MVDQSYITSGRGTGTAVGIPYMGAGMASADQGNYYPGTEELISGALPQYGVFENFPIKANAAAFLPFTPVVVGSDGYLIPATKGTPAIGITTAYTQVQTTDQSIAIARGGCFNPAALNYDASFVTDADKIGAFRGAAAPTEILVRPRR